MQETARQKQSDVQTDITEKFNYFMQCVSIRNEDRNHDLVISLIYFKTTGISFVCVQVLGRRNLKEILWERFVQKEYHLCNTNEMDEKITNKNTSQKFNVKTAGSSTIIVNEFEMKNFQNRRE